MFLQYQPTSQANKSYITPLDKKPYGSTCKKIFKRFLFPKAHHLVKVCSILASSHLGYRIIQLLSPWLLQLPHKQKSITELMLTRPTRA
jgi:hypothetical protein